MKCIIFEEIKEKQNFREPLAKKFELKFWLSFCCLAKIFRGEWLAQ